MKSKLLLVEGLPGFGKSTTANLLHDILSQNNINTSLFLEGNLDHPADYDGVSYFDKKDFEDLIVCSGNLKEVLNERILKKNDNYFLPYRKIINDHGSVFQENLFNTIFKNDIYELPFEKNVELITQKWEEFVEQAINEDKIYIFECCFIQNPLTIGMVKYGVEKEKVIEYVLSLAKIIKKLNPVLFYIEQDDLDFSFKKAFKERPEEWSSGFIQYYTNQGYGKMKGYQGLEGTINVLRARRDLEIEIVDMLPIIKTKINNSQYETAKYRSMLIDKLRSFEVM